MAALGGAELAIVAVLCVALLVLPLVLVAIVRIFTRRTPGAASAQESLKELERLREQGLINQTEFDQKRTEILRRL
jgi:cytochrome c-type biogenesis protein CcmH/NrfG